jgi:phosphoribosylformimino-5-aminoimidazole carboxamide ribotide isomerase
MTGCRRSHPGGVLPVLDLMAGHVVRGIAGRRHEYRPLSPVSEPLAVARSFRERFGLSVLYLADLDAIAGLPPALSLVQTLQDDGFSLWVDAGLKHGQDAEPLLRGGVERVIAGLETLAGPEELAAAVRTCGPERLVFSLDLRAGVSLASRMWGDGDPLAIVGRAVAVGVRSAIVLDLTSVGVGQGPGTDALLTACRQRWPELELTAGGGVRGIDDLRRLADLGVDHVLIASALHDGKLSPADVASCRSGSSPGIS